VTQGAFIPRPSLHAGRSKGYSEQRQRPGLQCRKDSVVARVSIGCLQGGIIVRVSWPVVVVWGEIEHGKGVMRAFDAR
jgi:hypothetical protein